MPGIPAGACSDVDGERSRGEAPAAFLVPYWIACHRRPSVCVRDSIGGFGRAAAAMAYVYLPVADAARIDPGRRLRGCYRAFTRLYPVFTGP